MGKIEDKIAEKIVSKIDIELLTDKIAEKVAEKILERDLGILGSPPNPINPIIPEPINPPPFTPRPYDPWRDNIVVMYGTNSTPYDTTVLTKASQIFYKPKEENKK